MSRLPHEHVRLCILLVNEELDVSKLRLLRVIPLTETCACHLLDMLVPMCVVYRKKTTAHSKFKRCFCWNRC